MLFSQKNGLSQLFKQHSGKKKRQQNEKSVGETGDKRGKSSVSSQAMLISLLLLWCSSSLPTLIQSNK